METQTTANYTREFVHSKYHMWLGIGTVGLGLWSASFFGLIIGVTAYVVGILMLPDSKFFRSKIDTRIKAENEEAERAKVAEFRKKRDEQLHSLSASNQGKYYILSTVCRDIEKVSTDNVSASGSMTFESGLRKLDELMWTYLRLLKMEDALRLYLEVERKEDVPTRITEAETELTQLNERLQSTQNVDNKPKLDHLQRLISSRIERLEVLKKRIQRIDTAKQNIDLVVSEQDRLCEQIKLLRADSIATKNADVLSMRIDASVEHLNETNKWLSEMDEFVDLVDNMPDTPMRVGYGSVSAPDSNSETATSSKRIRLKTASR